MTDVTVLDRGGIEIEECLPNLRHRPPKTVGEPKWVLQQAWRISVIEKGGRTLGSRIEWRDAPFDPEAH